MRVMSYMTLLRSLRAAAKGEVARLLHNSSSSLTLVNAPAGQMMLKWKREMGTMCRPVKEKVSEMPKEIGARPKVRKCESLVKGARGGVKDHSTDLYPLDVVKARTPGIVKTGPKSGSVLKRSVEDTLTGIGRLHASAVGPVFIFPGEGSGPPLLSLTVSLADVVTPLVAGEVKGAIVSDGEEGSEDPAKYR